MADEKQSTVVELVAVERGFLDGALVEPGTKFRFETLVNGRQRKIPKWAAKPGDPRLARAKRVLTAADFKPQNAELAARKKIENARDLAG